MPFLIRGFIAGLRALVTLLLSLPFLFHIFADLLRNLWYALGHPKHRNEGNCCVDLPPNVHRRPDPLIYSQPFLMAHGLAVTWDNPDIQLYQNNQPVSSSALGQDQDYQVVVRIWNNSYHAPAVALPVHLAFLTFGIGTTSTPIGTTFVDLGAKGTPHCPAYANFTWHTPNVAGHYCLQVGLEWADDANPQNNYGQENTNVGQLQSPATFEFPVHNDAAVTRTFEVEADTYQIPPRTPCASQETPVVIGKPVEDGQHLFSYRPSFLTKKPPSLLARSRAQWAKALAKQRYGLFPVPAEWSVNITPERFSLGPNEERWVVVTIESLNPEFSGRQAFNVNAFASGQNNPRCLVGGVTLYVER